MADVAAVAQELQRDFDGACVALAGELTANDDPTAVLAVLVALVESADALDGSKQTSLTPELVTRLDTEFLPQVVQLLLSRSYDADAATHVNRFLQRTLVSVARSLQQGDVSRLPCLGRVLDAHRRFYLFHGADDERESPESHKTLKFAAESHGDYTSRYFVRNLEYWGRLDGFSLLLELLKAGASFETLQSVLRVLYAVKDQLQPTFLADFFSRLATTVRGFVRELPASDFHAVSRDALLEVVQVLELLLAKVQHELEADKGQQHVQLLQLELSLRFFRSTSLEKRIYGLTELVVAITRLYNDQIQEQPEPTAATLRTALGYLLDWMHDTQLVQELLGDKMHVELIKRSTSLFQFASELECLPTEWLDLVWQCYHADGDGGNATGTDVKDERRPPQQRHEASRSTVHDLLLEMVEFMDLPLLRHLVMRLEAVRANLDANHLALLMAIAARRLVVDNNDTFIEDGTGASLRQRILRHLWETVLPSVRCEAIRDQVLQCMQEMLRDETSILEQDERGEGEENHVVGVSVGSRGRGRGCAMVDEFLRLCLENLSGRVHLEASLKFMAQLAMLVSDSGVLVSVPLSADSTCVQVVLDEILEYKRRIGLDLQTTEWEELDDKERARLTPLSGHVDAIKLRLLALRASWILDARRREVEPQITSPSFARPEMDLVWSTLISNAFLLDEAALCFQWIELCLNTPLLLLSDREAQSSSAMLMPLNIARYLLATKFHTLSGVSITLSTLCCFHNIFRRVNLLQGGLESFTPTATSANAAQLSMLASPRSSIGSVTSVANEKEVESIDLVTGESLVGLDELWHLAITATDSDVAEEAITLLVSFYLAFIPSLRATELPFQHKLRFLEKCMAFLMTAKSNAEKFRLLEDDKVGDRNDGSHARSLNAEVSIVNRCVDLLRYFLQACDSEGDSEGDVAKEYDDGESVLQPLDTEDELNLSKTGQDTRIARKSTFHLEHLEEKLQFLEVFPSPMKDQQVDTAVANTKLGFRAARRPSWTFRQQHALLDAIVDENEEGDEAEAVSSKQSVRSVGQGAAPRDFPLLQLHLEGSSEYRSLKQSSPLQVDAGADFLKPGMPIQSSMRSPTLHVRANLHWPESPSPQRGPDLNPEDVSQALTAFASYKAGKVHEAPTDDPAVTEKSEKLVALSHLSDQSAKVKTKTKYGIMSQLLANQGSHFAVLMELVDWDETTSQRVWDLLCYLPTNNELLRQMIRLRPLKVDEAASPETTDTLADDVQWSTLLDTSNTHRLLYALRLVEALLVPIEKSLNTNQDRDCGRRQWRERFLRLGGGSHLYNALLHWPKEPLVVNPSTGVPVASLYARNLRATCLAAVVRTLRYFLRLADPSVAEKLCYDKLSAFDLRLQCSTLPAFAKAIDLAAILRRVMQLTGSLCSGDDERATSRSLSAESAEAILNGTQMCCTVLAIAPTLAVQTFASDDEGFCAETTGASGEITSFTIFCWLKMLLLDCPSATTRTQLLGTLSDTATTSSLAPPSSAFWTLFEQLVVSSCELVASVTAQEVQGGAGFEQLFAFTHFLLQRCNDLKTHDVLGHTSEATIELIVTTVTKKHVPDRLITALYQSACQQHEARYARGNSRAKSQRSGMLEDLLQVLVLLVGVSDDLRLAIRRCEPKNLSRPLGGSPMLRDADWIIGFVLKDLLFGELSTEFETTSQPICETRASRVVAQRLLLSLFSAQPSEGVSSPSPALESEAATMVHVLQYQRVYQERILETVNLAGRQWNYNPADTLQDTVKGIDYAGLVNPGCICYMNALVQQLFMIPTFRDGLLSLDSGKTAAGMTSSSSWKDEVQQLQRLFASLAYTEARSVDPTTFALSHKDMDGNPTDVRVQMDADEFFCLLLDRVEMHIRSQSPARDKKASDCTTKAASDAAANESKDFMERCFGGVLVNQVLTQQGHLSEREEKFFALSLEVSKKRYLTESLALYVQGESLEGENAYFCERMQQKVSATKRICIKTLPRTLVCHLKRFEFDFDTMEKVKINDYLEFPTEIDMFPYTSEALAAESSEDHSNVRVGNKAIMYDLVGVVVHSGTSDMGHYYSFIKDRWEGGLSQRWLEFNDEVVREFDDETMGTECFGGEEVTSKWDRIQGSYSPSVQMKRRNAYMLIYEQRETVKGSTRPTTTDTLALSKHSTEVQEIVRKIKLENARFQGVVNSFDAAYEQFVHALVERVVSVSSRADPVTIRQACQSACQYLFGISSLNSRSSASMQQNNGTPAPNARPSESSGQKATVTHIVEWLSTRAKDTNGDDNEEEERVAFSKWVLTEVVTSPASPTALTKTSPTVSDVETQRTWLFDVLFLNGSSLELADSCFRVLSAAVSVLVRRLAEGTGSDGSVEQVLVRFFREVLDLFYEREQDLDVRDAGSGSIVALSVAVRVRAVERLGEFLESVCASTPANHEGSHELVVRHLLLGELQFIDRFLLTLQTACSAKDAAIYAVRSSLLADPPTGSMASLGIEADGATSRRPSHLRFCTFQLETRLLSCMLQPYAAVPETQTSDVRLLFPPVDTTLLMNNVAIKNVLLLGLEDLLAPVVVHIALGSESSSSRCDRLVSLLVTELEEVKTTHVDKMLAIFGHLLDAEEARAKPFNTVDELCSSDWNVHRHVFSPSRGILEGATYYKDHHSLQEYAFVLLEFTLLRAGTSRALQTLFQSDAEFRSQVDWIPDWIVSYLDASGVVRQKMEKQCNDKNDGDAVGGASGDERLLNEETKLIKEVQMLFLAAEKAFGVTIQPCCGANSEVSQQQLTLPVAHTDDVLLESLASDTSENQTENHESTHWPSDLDSQGSNIRSRLKARTKEAGPQHDAVETEECEACLSWMTHRRSREDLASLLRLDLDAVHNEVREAREA